MGDGTRALIQEYTMFHLAVSGRATLLPWPGLNHTMPTHCQHLPIACIYMLARVCMFCPFQTLTIADSLYLKVRQQSAFSKNRSEL